MRTTINLDDDVAKAVAALREERGVGLSEAVNELAREGLRSARVDYVYPGRSFDMGALVDLSNVAEVLDLLDAPEPGAG